MRRPSPPGRLRLLGLALGLGCTVRLPATARQPPGVTDPRVAVTDWAQVHRYHCARTGSGAVTACTRDADCADGRVCDTSAACGCCVAPPPSLTPTASTLHRYLMTACTAGVCAPPLFCTPGRDATRCTMRFESEVPLWASTFVPPSTDNPLAEVRRALCIRVEPAQHCLWVLDLPPGSYTADAPMPTRYAGEYECGGRTCNGHDAVRASPAVGSSHTVRLLWHRCGA